MSNSAKNMRKIIERINKLEEMNSITIYPHGAGQDGVTIPVKNGMVSRIVSAVGHENVPDAIWLAKILNNLSDDAFRH